ncbi:MAG: tRNA (adenine(22)-N(1))-methyltransferase [Emergencia sp.]
MKLSDRLQTIADEIKKGETMADIGTDHGFLPLYLLEKGISPKVIMADISRGSLKKAEDNCRAFTETTTFSGSFEFRLGDGIDVLEDGEVDVVVMAGIGGKLICDMLQWDLRKSRSMKRYILQPRNHPGMVRRWLHENGFTITRESLVREGRFICVILTAESGPKPEAGTVEEISDACFDYPEGLVTWAGPLTGEYLELRMTLEKEVMENIRKNSRFPELAQLPVAARIAQLEHLKEELEMKQ